MGDWIATGLIVVGALTSVAGAIKGNFAYARYFRAARASSSDRRLRAIAGVELAYAAAVAGIIVGAGVTMLVVGLIIGRGVEAWTVSMPVALAAGAALAAALARRTLAQLSNSE